MIKMPSETWSLSPKHTYIPSTPEDKFYDNLPYERNYDHCNSDHITMESGNILKFYSCKESKKSYAIPNQDDVFMELIAKQQHNKDSEEKNTDLS